MIPNRRTAPQSDSKAVIHNNVAEMVSDANLNRKQTCYHRRLSYVRYMYVPPYDSRRR